MRQQREVVLRGRVRNGLVVLRTPSALHEGTEVEIRPKACAKTVRKAPAKKRRTLYDIFKPLIGKAKGLPPDASLNVDHYLYGIAKRR